MEKAILLLRKHWGYDAFRKDQIPVVQSVIENKHTLALLPTGGGKSICYQIPALCNKGLAIVISPLISLMDDQAEGLRKRGIAAINLSGKISEHQLDLMLERCVNLEVKFLFISPERLQHKTVQLRLKRMSICNIVIDEAHCVSQWGHDFRPSYLKIKESLQEVKAPILALTAKATDAVVNDINQYVFGEENPPTLLRSSFLRPNLAYFIKQTESKQEYILRVCKKFSSSGIMYTRSRKSTGFWTNLLVENGIKALPYHAGMSVQARELNQAKWMESNSTVMVATSAFGMGIDKPNVRFVIHPELPESLEAFIQEAGRAGRDGKKAYSILLHQDNDLTFLEKKLLEDPPTEKELNRFQAQLMNFLQVPVGHREFLQYYFSLDGLAKYCDQSQKRVLTLLDHLRLEERIDFNPPENSSPKVQVRVSSSAFYDATIKYQQLAPLMDALVRIYQGIFEFPVSIDQERLAKYCNINYKDIHVLLTRLKTMGFIAYYPVENRWRITLLKNRLVDNKYIFSNEKVKLINKRKELSYHSLAKYLALTAPGCRQKYLCEYFGDSPEDCGVCDLCLEKTENGDLADLILKKLKEENVVKIQDLLISNQLFRLKEEQFYRELQSLKASGDIEIEESTETIHYKK